MTEQADRKIRVLIADDHTILREGIRSLLEREPDIEVVGEAADGAEAVAKVDQLRPDAVLLDVGMPNMNGIEATRRIKAKHPDICVLILSMHDDEEYVRPLMQSGASGYVLKRSATTDLVVALRAAVRGHTVLAPELARSAFGSERPQAAPAKAETYDNLTQREVEVLRLIAEGLTNQEIADKLVISVKTVQAHRANIMEKLDLHDAVELTKYAIRKGIIQLDED